MGDPNDEGSEAGSEDLDGVPLVSEKASSVGDTDEDVGSDRDSNISKETLELGQTSPNHVVPSSDDEQFQCSQVSSGWLGAAYNHESRMEKARKQEELARNQHAQKLRGLAQVLNWQKHLYWQFNPMFC